MLECFTVIAFPTDLCQGWLGRATGTGAKRRQRRQQDDLSDLWMIQSSVQADSGGQTGRVVGRQADIQLADRQQKATKKLG